MASSLSPHSFFQLPSFFCLHIMSVHLGFASLKLLPILCLLTTSYSRQAYNMGNTLNGWKLIHHEQLKKIDSFQQILVDLLKSLAWQIMLVDPILPLYPVSNLPCCFSIPSHPTPFLPWPFSMFTVFPSVDKDVYTWSRL